jgi:hypothetical protein
MDETNEHQRRLSSPSETQLPPPGAYFITLVTYQARCLLGEIQAGQVVLSPVGSSLKAVWQRLANHFQNIRTDAVAIMPNHFHGILWVLKDGLTEKLTTHDERKDQKEGSSPPPGWFNPGALHDVVQYLKTEVLQDVHKHHTERSLIFWQPDHLELSIHTQKELWSIREYILSDASNQLSEALRNRYRVY